LTFASSQTRLTLDNPTRSEAQNACDCRLLSPIAVALILLSVAPRLVPGNAGAACARIRFARYCTIIGIADACASS
jgi:hypothetical protein